MKPIRQHGPVLLLLAVVVATAFGRLIGTPLFHRLDFVILQEAHQLAQSPLEAYRHLGTYFTQPVLQLAFLLEYTLFCDQQAGYIAVNLVIHTLNAFLVYMLVNMLFARRKMAVLAALLFALTIGSYGKILTTIAYLESVLLAFLHLLVLYFLIRNDFRHQGRIRSRYFLLGLGIFLTAGLTKASTFSILGCLIAYKFLFYRERGGRGVLSGNLLILVGVGVLFYLAQGQWGAQRPAVHLGSDGGALSFTLTSFKNIFRYLNLMVFPLQPSALLQHANPVVLLVYDIRTYIRILLTLAVLSYSLFGIVFGSSAVRFFIAWTYITLIPFTGTSTGGEWLNIQYLYLTSLGFCVILAAGTVSTANLLSIHRWRSLVPYLIPVLFAALAVSITHQIDRQNRLTGQRPEIAQLRAELAERCRAGG